MKIITKRALYFISNVWTLSLIFTLIAILLLPPLFDKYKLTEVKGGKLSKERIYFADLDNDGYSEKIRVDNVAKGIGVTVMTRGGVMDQWNFKGKLFNKGDPFQREIFFEDADNDGVKEIFVGSLFQDSVYLSCFNPFTDSVYFKEKAITDFRKTNGKIDGEMVKCALYDMNGDNIKEIYFVINAGYSHYPRRMFCYDFVNDKIYKSPYGNTPYGYPNSFDLDNDGKPEFFGSTDAVGNSKSTEPFSDQFTWLIVLDEKLNFKFKPIKLYPFPTGASVIPFQDGNNRYIAFLNNYTGTKKLQSSFALFNGKGIKKREIFFKKNFNLEDSYLFCNNDKFDKLFLICGNSGIIREYDNDLKIKNEYQFPFLGREPVKFDLDKDGKREIIFCGKYFDKIIITRNDFSDPLIVDIPRLGNGYYFSLIKNGNKKNQLYLCGENYYSIFEYDRNVLYYFRYFIYAGIFGAFFLLFSVIQHTQKRKAEEKYKTERKIAELQLLGIKNQTDPHFTLNILNSIGTLIYKNDKDKADFIFGKYSKLLRNTITASDKIVTTLEKEIEYVENYLELEKFRLNNKFDYKIIIDGSVDVSFEIPKTLIHTFVENSIKHGIKPLEGKGEILIKIYSEENKYKILIRDNGVGRKKAKELHTFGTGKGLGILKQILDLYYSLYKKKISFEIKDAYNGERPTGTEAHIIIQI